MENRPELLTTEIAKEVIETNTDNEVEEVIEGGEVREEEVVLGGEEAEEVNLEVDNVTMEHEIKVHLPAPKKRKTESVHWGSCDLPSFPLLVNKKAIKAHQRLAVFLDPPKTSPTQEADEKTDPKTEAIHSDDLTEVVEQQITTW